MSSLDDQMKAAENEWPEGWKSGPIRTRWTELPLQIIRLGYRYNYCKDFPAHRVLLAAIREAKKSIEQ